MRTLTNTELCGMTHVRGWQPTLKARAIKDSAEPTLIKIAEQIKNPDGSVNYSACQAYIKYYMANIDNSGYQPGTEMVYVMYLDFATVLEFHYSRGIIYNNDSPYGLLNVLNAIRNDDGTLKKLQLPQPVVTAEQQPNEQVVDETIDESTIIDTTAHEIHEDALGLEDKFQKLKAEREAQKAEQARAKKANKDAKKRRKEYEAKANAETLAAAKKAAEEKAKRLKAEEQRKTNMAAANSTVAQQPIPHIIQMGGSVAQPQKTNRQILQEATNAQPIQQPVQQGPVMLNTDRVNSKIGFDITKFMTPEDAKLVNALSPQQFDTILYGAANHMLANAPNNSIANQLLNQAPMSHAANCTCDQCTGARQIQFGSQQIQPQQVQPEPQVKREKVQAEIINAQIVRPGYTPVPINQLPGIPDPMPGVGLENKAVYLKKHIKFIQDAHTVGLMEINGLIEMLNMPMLTEACKKYNAKCRANNLYMREVQLTEEQRQSFNYAFRIACKNKKKEISVLFSTVPVYDPAIQSWLYRIDVSQVDR